MARVKAGEPVEIVLPIASFLDMAFQILAFFIFTYNPSNLEGQMEMALPASGEARAQTPEQVDPTTLPDKDPELKTEITITIKSNQSGETRALGTISQISVEGTEGVASTVPVDLERDPDLKGLQNYLIKIQRGLGNKDSIKIRADSALKYAF